MSILNSSGSASISFRFLRLDSSINGKSNFHFFDQRCGRTAAILGRCFFLVGRRSYVCLYLVNFRINHVVSIDKMDIDMPLTINSIDVSCGRSKYFQAKMYIKETTTKRSTAILFLSRDLTPLDFTIMPPMSFNDFPSLFSFNG